jgi:hypothetical protein
VRLLRLTPRTPLPVSIVAVARPCAAARRAVATPCPVDEVVVSVPQPLALARSVRSLSLLVSASIAY